MQPGDVIHYERLVCVVLDVEPEEECSIETQRRWFGLSVQTPKCWGTTKNLQHCHSIDVTVECTYLTLGTVSEAKSTSQSITLEELATITDAMKGFHHRMRLCNVVSHLMHMQHVLLPLLREEITAAETMTRGRKAALDRLHQMDELIDFFVAISEASPRNAIKNLSMRQMPHPPENAKKDSLRSKVKIYNALSVVSDLVEELALYCQSDWIRQESEPQAKYSMGRLNSLWEVVDEYGSEMTNYLFRLPLSIRREIGDLRR